MSNRSGRWPLEDRLPDADPELLSAVGLTLRAQPRDWNLTLINGYLDCAPIGSVGGKFILALRAVAGRSPDEGAAVLLHPNSGESRLVCDSAAGAIPALFLELLYDCPDVVWDALRAAPEGAWRELADAHVALGGAEGQIALLRQILDDDRCRAAMIRAELRKPSSHVDLVVEAMTTLMAGQPRAAFLDYQELVLSEEPRPDPDPVQLRAWTPVAWTIHTYHHMINYPERAIPEPQWRSALLQALRRPAGQEGPYNGPAERPLFNAAESRGLGATWYVAEALRDEYPSLEADHPLVRASRTMLARGPGDYEGLAHAEAAAALYAAGDTELAISAMLSSAFFNKARFGSVMQPTIGAYRALVREAGAQPHADVIERHWSRTDPDAC